MPANYSSDQLDWRFGTRAEIHVSSDDLGQPEKLKATVAAACDMMEEAHKRLWRQLRRSSFRARSGLPILNPTPATNFEWFRCFEDMSYRPRNMKLNSRLDGTPLAQDR